VRFAGQAAPPHDGSETIGKVLVLIPEPQVAEHDEKADQLPTTQSTGQHCGLHDCDDLGTSVTEAGHDTERV